MSRILLTLLLLGGSRAAAFAQAMNSATSSLLAVPGAALYYEECGTAAGTEAVVLIHDGIVHSAVWDGVWPAFCRRFHVIRYDRRGYGRSTASTTWHSEADDLER